MAIDLMEETDLILYLKLLLSFLLAFLAILALVVFLKIVAMIIECGFAVTNFCKKLAARRCSGTTRSGRNLFKRTTNMSRFLHNFSSLSEASSSDTAVSPLMEKYRANLARLQRDSWAVKGSPDLAAIYASKEQLI